MPLSSPRIPPVSIEEMNALDTELGRRREPGQPPLNITRTVARHPALVKARAPLERHLLRESTLPPRERELAILRTGWAWQSEYEFSQHTHAARSHEAPPQRCPRGRRSAPSPRASLAR